MEKRFVSISILKYVPYPLEILFIVLLSSYVLTYALTFFALFILLILCTPFFDLHTQYRTGYQKDQWSLFDRKGLNMDWKRDRVFNTQNKENCKLDLNLVDIDV